MGNKVYVGARTGPDSRQPSVSVLQDGDPRQLSMRLDLREDPPDALDCENVVDPVCI